MRRDIMSRGRRRAWWRRRRAPSGWSRTNLLRLRIHHGATITAEPALVVLYPEHKAWHVPPLVRIQVPHAGFELAIGRHVFRRRVTAVPRTPKGVRAAAIAWQLELANAGHVILSEPLDTCAARGAGWKELEAYVCRALVLELLGRVGAKKSVSQQTLDHAR